MKSTKLAIVLSGMVASFSGAVFAESCYKLDPFSDVLRVDVRINEDVVGKTHHALNGSWVGAGVYTLPFTGSRELNAGSTTVRRIGGVGTQSSGFFGGNLICGLDGVVNGPWQIQCSGGTAGNFQTSGTSLTKVSCNGVIPSAPSATGPLAGE